MDDATTHPRGPSPISQSFRIRFRFRKPGTFKEDMLDPIAGSLTATFLTTDTNTDKTMWSEAYDLQCKPMQRMF